MKIINTVQGIHEAGAGQPAPVLVPTMGNLHAGHLSLVDIACQRAGNRPVMVSIFVNPLQFGPSEDFDSYPRTFEEDCDKLADAGCDIVFAPSVSDLYPTEQTFRVAPDSAMASVLEGAARPGFFDGVCTVVMKLFCTTRPALAVFGRKDFQQLMIIRAMVRQFAMPIDIIAGDTVREDDGLAMSSRNGYLDDAQRREAPELQRALKQVARMWQQSAGAGIDEIQAQRERLGRRGWQVDYFGAYHGDTLAELTTPSSAPAGNTPTVLLTAARLGKVRLIDNIEVIPATGSV